MPKKTDKKGRNWTEEKRSDAAIAHRKIDDPSKTDAGAKRETEADRINFYLESLKQFRDAHLPIEERDIEDCEILLLTHRDCLSLTQIKEQLEANGNYKTIKEIRGAINRAKLRLKQVNEKNTGTKICAACGKPQDL